MRSLAFHRAIARKLRNNPGLWDVPLDNIERWSSQDANLGDVYREWLHILKSSDRERILALLENADEESKRLRSSTPFTGILTEAERLEIVLSQR